MKIAKNYYPEEFHNQLITLIFPVLCTRDRGCDAVVPMVHWQEIGGGLDDLVSQATHL